MRSNSLDFSSFEAMAPPTTYKKTERTHEENQERAYIAASRRTDRSLEARVQSARMASDIHKKRTGKSFRITEEIVLAEEMYEEEDDILPRSYRVLGGGVQKTPSDVSSRVGDYLSSKVAVSSLLARSNAEWRHHEVNQKFAEAFPHIPSYAATASFPTRLQQAQQPQSEPQQPQSEPEEPQSQPQQSSPPLPQQQHPNPSPNPHQQQQQTQPHQQKQQQMPPHQPQQLQQMPPQPPRQHYQHHQPLLYQSSHYHQQAQPMSQQFSGMPFPVGSLPPPHRFYPQHSSSRLSTSGPGQCPPQQPGYWRQDSGIGMPVSPLTFDPSSQPESPLGLGSSGSAFTSALPPEARMMMGLPTGSEHSQNWSGMDGSVNTSYLGRDIKTEEDDRHIETGEDGSLSGPYPDRDIKTEEEEDQVISPTGYNLDMSNPRWLATVQGTDESNWDTFMNDNAWAADNQ
ncbi:hypothetical protein ISF_00220 [Cordyceps fumosorosea ARSEF 2679]|uniref:Uncharacterized protein n=1 Tax=Cordyceps fumosorosea (strain ARSEF 2679) TaxID=1081104 RepID=A0A162N007_CORFA|nr:hypothetical protein ISF_00220 [Cordyceps fumosorosea ARSEF 2679]OAA73319.1 hypothetical protein ISF_00220 [Cordyceps fumosorosea ARSEF 2679]